MAFIWLPDKLNARTHTHTHTYRRTHIKFHRTRGVATHTFKNSPPLFFNPMPIFPPAFSDLLLRFEWTKIQAMTRRVAESHVFILSLICSLDGWSKMHPKKAEDHHVLFFPPNTVPKVSMCYVAMTRFTLSNSHVMIQPTVTPHQGSTVRAFATKNYCVRVDYEKIFRSTCATDQISIFVFVLRELQRFLTYPLLQLSNVS